MWPDVPSRARPAGCRRRLALVVGVALVAGVAVAQAATPPPSILAALSGYLVFAGVGFLFGGFSYLVRIARRNGTPIDPRAMTIRCVIGAGAGLLGLWPVDAAGAASPPIRLAATAGAAIAGERIFRLAAGAAAAERGEPGTGGTT